MLTAQENKTYATILSDGKIHITVPEGTEGSVVRTYETSDGTKGSKTEMVYTNIVGKITGINFKEGNYGMQLQLTISDGTDKPVVLSLGTSSNFGEDAMKKLININLDKKVKIAPFAFKDEKGKSKKGLTIWQMNDETKKVEKVQNYFYDPKNKCNTNGYPEPKPKKGKTTKDFTTDQWKLYFGECREFLIEKITEHFKIEEQSSATDEDFDALVEDFGKAEEAVA
jgi:hypothetical protein